MATILLEENEGISPITVNFVNRFQLFNFTTSFIFPLPPNTPNNAPKVR